MTATKDEGPLKCQTRGCEMLSVLIVFWPGQTTRLCGFCSIRAVGIARELGFDLATALDDGRDLGGPSASHVPAGARVSAAAPADGCPPAEPICSCGHPYNMHADNGSDGGMCAVLSCPCKHAAPASPPAPADAVTVRLVCWVCFRCAERHNVDRLPGRADPGPCRYCGVETAGRDSAVPSPMAPADGDFPAAPYFGDDDSVPDAVRNAPPALCASPLPADSGAAVVLCARYAGHPGPHTYMMSAGASPPAPADAVSPPLSAEERKRRGLCPLCGGGWGHMKDCPEWLAAAANPENTEPGRSDPDDDTPIAAVFRDGKLTIDG